jgi:hypothetical protein
VAIGESTLSDVRPAADGPVPRWGRRAGVVLLLVVVVAGAFGVFGVHSTTQSTAAGGYTMSVTYAESARAGLDVPFRAHIHDAGGFTSGLTLAVSMDYFRMFETQNFFPAADRETNDGTFMYFSFAKPRGSNFDFEYDAYIQPASQIGKTAQIELIVQGRVVARTSVHTWLMP